MTARFRPSGRAVRLDAPASRFLVVPVTDTNTSLLDKTAAKAVRATPAPLAYRVRGLSDRSIAWLFITPTIALLLAINIFPLIWAVYLSFTNFRANRPNAEIDGVGLTNYQRVLNDPDIWQAMQTTAHFVFWTILLQMLIGFALAYLIDRKFRGHAFWTTVILIPMMLSPAVVGNFWRFLYQPQIGLFNYIYSFFTGVPPSSFEMLGSVALSPWAIIIVDTWMWTPYVMLICLAGLRSIPDYIYEAAEVDRASAWRQFWSITVPMALPFIMLAVLFRAIENFKMFDMVVLLTGGGPGSTTEVASITLKREAFESWRTGRASAFAIILFVAVFGLANIYVKALNKVKQR
jgi:multiple sugar transport system permease protein